MVPQESKILPDRYDVARKEAAELGMRISVMDSQMRLLKEKHEAGHCAYERDVRYIISPLGIAVNDEGGFLVVYKPCVRMDRMKSYLYCVTEHENIIPITFDRFWFK